MAFCDFSFLESSPYEFWAAAVEGILKCPLTQPLAHDLFIH
jgi:hypothetical protein